MIPRIPNDTSINPQLDDEANRELKGTTFPSYDGKSIDPHLAQLQTLTRVNKGTQLPENIPDGPQDSDDKVDSDASGSLFARRATKNIPNAESFMGDRFLSVSVTATQKSDLMLKNITANSCGSTHFHGSRSGSLIAFHKSTAEEVRGSLLPMGILVKHEAAVFSGERGNAFHVDSINRNCLSTVNAINVNVAIEYATDLTFARKSPLLPKPRSRLMDSIFPGDVAPKDASEKMRDVVSKPRSGSQDCVPLEGDASEDASEKMRTIDSKPRSRSIGAGSLSDSGPRNDLEKMQNKMRNIAEKKLEYLACDPGVKAIISENFPVVYGLMPDLDKVNRNANSAIAGEVGILGGCAAGQIKAIFVPDDKVSIVASYLKECEFGIVVKSLSALKS